MFYCLCRVSKQTLSFIRYIAATGIWNKKTHFWRWGISPCKFTCCRGGKQLCSVAEGMASRHHCLNNCSLEPRFASAEQLPFLLPSPGSEKPEEWWAEIFCKVILGFWGFFLLVFYNIVWMLWRAEVMALQTRSIKTRCWIYNLCWILKICLGFVLQVKIKQQQIWPWTWCRNFHWW